MTTRKRASKRTTTTVVEDARDDAADGDGMDALDDALAGAPRDRIAKVYRLEDGDFAFCGQLAAADATEAAIARYGAGEYRVRVWGPTERDRRKLRQLAQYTVRISAAAAVAAQPKEEAAADPGAMVDRMMAAGMVQMLRSMEQNAAATAAVIAQMVQTQTAVMQTMMESRRDDSPVMQELMRRALEPRDELAGLERAVKLLGAGRREPDWLEQFERMEALRERLAPDGESDGGGHLGWVRDLARAIIPAIGQGNAPADAPAAPPAAPLALVEDSPVEDAMPSPFDLLAPVIPAILADADAGMAPADSAAYHLQRAPAWARASVRALLDAPNAAAQVGASFPALAGRAARVDGWVAAARGGVADGNGDAPESEPATAGG